MEMDYSSIEMRKIAELQSIAMQSGEPDDAREPPS